MELFSLNWLLATVGVVTAIMLLGKLQIKGEENDNGSG